MVRFEEVGLLLLEIKRASTQLEGFFLVGGGPQVMQREGLSLRASSLEVLGLVAKSETRKTKFAIQRFVELLDPTTPFFHSVHLSISPQESVREALDLLQMYQDKPSFVNYHLIACLRRTHKLLKTDFLIQENFDSTLKLKDFLTEFLKSLTQSPNRKVMRPISGLNLY